jgi:hypothetical protein
MHEFFIGDFDTEEVAKQLTLITHQHYSRVRIFSIIIDYLYIHCTLGS